MKKEKIPLIVGIITMLLFLPSMMNTNNTTNEYFENTHQKLKTLKLNDKVTIGNVIYELKNTEITNKIENYNFSNEKDNLSIIVDNNVITIINQNEKCGYIIDTLKSKYKKIPDKEDKWIMSTDSDITDLLKSIFKETEMEKCNTINF